MKYLVTGGAGFIGSNIVEELLNHDNEVVVLDNLHTGSVENLKDLRSNSLTFIEAPCSTVLEMFKNEKFNGIFHFGIPSSAPMYKENQHLVGEAISDFIKILELSKINECRLVYASTSSLYNGLSMPFQVDIQPLVTDFYTEVRICMERLAKLYYDFYGIQSIGLRLFSVYGPREKAKKQYANLVSQFLWTMQKNEVPVVYGDGEQTRDFTYVKDVVKASILAINSEIKCDVFNIETGKNYTFYTLNQIINLLNEILEKNIKQKYIENPIQNYVQHTLANTTKAENLLGFKSEYNVKDGIQINL